MSTSRKTYLKIGLALLAVYLIWGSTYLAIRIALESFPPFLLAGLRNLTAGIILYVFLRARGTPPPTRAQWLGSALIGGLLLGGGNGGVTFAEQWVDSGLAAIWIATMPLWAALFAGFWGRWPNRFEWIGLSLGFVGVAILNLEGNLRANPIGVIALLIAAVTWALGSVWSRHVTLPVGPMSSAAQMLTGSLLLFMFSFSTGERMAAPPNQRAVLAILYLIAFGSLVGYSAYNYLLRQVKPTLATSYAYVNPAVAVLFGVLLGGEHITGFGVVAMLVILSGVALVMAAKEKKETRP